MHARVFGWVGRWTLCVFFERSQVKIIQANHSIFPSNVKVDLVQDGGLRLVERVQGRDDVLVRDLRLPGRPVDGLGRLGLPDHRRDLSKPALPDATPPTVTSQNKLKKRKTNGKQHEDLQNVLPNFTESA